MLVLCLAGCGQVVPGAGAPVDVDSHQRPGHPPNWPGIGDRGGLVSRPGGPSGIHGGVLVVQACDLLTPEDVHDLGLGPRAAVPRGW